MYEITSIKTHQFYEMGIYYQKINEPFYLVMKNVFEYLHIELTNIVTL